MKIGDRIILLGDSSDIRTYVDEIYENGRVKVVRYDKDGDVSIYVVAPATIASVYDRHFPTSEPDYTVVNWLETI